jgi:hypothetical protein
LAPERRDSGRDVFALTTTAGGSQQTTLSTVAGGRDGSGETIVATQASLDEAANATVDDGVDTLAVNMALGRNWAAIHYRTNGIGGLNSANRPQFDT